MESCDYRAMQSLKAEQIAKKSRASGTCSFFVAGGQHEETDSKSAEGGRIKIISEPQAAEFTKKKIEEYKALLEELDLLKK